MAKGKGKHKTSEEIAALNPPPLERPRKAPPTPQLLPPDTPVPRLELPPELAEPRLPEPPVAGDPQGLPHWLLERLRRLTVEKARRKVEGLALYEPLPVQQAFHASLAPERTARGSNRGGKTLPAAVEVARAVTGRDPLGRYPARDGRCFAVGKDFTHVGQVMYRKLFRAGAFKIIRDARTGHWRAYRPWEAGDLARAKDTKPAPPLIPSRMVKEIAWESKKESIPKMVKLANGWEINFFSSQGEPPNGADVDLVWFDEEIEHRDWYPEMSARLLDRAGRFIWSATPQAGTEELFELHERSEQAKLNPGEPALVEEFVITLADNPHIDEVQKRQLAAKLSDEEGRVRIGGEFAVTSMRVFPEWSRITHGVEYFQIPLHWARYAAVDPGRQVCAVLFLAVPPPEEGHEVYAYDELYLANCNAALFGKRMGEKCAHQTFQAFIIDHHEARKAEAGSGNTIEFQYAAALRQNKVRSLKTGHGFLWGSDDVASGIEACRSQLLIGESGQARLRVVLERCPNLDWEMRHYRFKKVNGVVTDKPEERGRVHLMACWRYLAMHGTPYVRPPKAKAPKSLVVSALQKKRQRQKDAHGGPGFVRLGPGRPSYG